MKTEEEITRLAGRFPIDLLDEISIMIGTKRDKYKCTYIGHEIKDNKILFEATLINETGDEVLISTAHEIQHIKS